MRAVSPPQPSGLPKRGANPLPWRIPAPVSAGIGVVLLVGVIMYGAVTHAPFHVGFLALALLGAMLQVAAPFLDQPGSRSADSAAQARAASVEPASRSR